MNAHLHLEGWQLCDKCGGIRVPVCETCHAAYARRHHGKRRRLRKVTK